MAEKLTDFLTINQIKATYMHSEIKTLDRIKILKKLRMGEVDVLVGINLLREGLDLPEVSLVIVLDADREGFLRSETALIQIFGRASRNLKGRVILYMQETTGSIERAVRESNRRREFQIKYNEIHGIKPVSITKSIKDFYDDNYWIRKSEEKLDYTFDSKEDLLGEIEKLTKEMKKKADLLEFNSAAAIRDRIIKLKRLQIEIF
jgi:excinuclease ABC subunit B